MRTLSSIISSRTRNSDQPVLPLLKRIELQQLRGFTTTHVVGEVAHRLMTMEAVKRHGWGSKVLQRLRSNSTAIQQLTEFEQAVLRIPQFGIKILAVTDILIQTAVRLSRQFGLLINDALIVAVMQHHNLSYLASNDSDFDHVPGITRYAPV